MDLEEVWRIREEDIYPRLFGPVTRGIFPLSAEMFLVQFKQPGVDPRWLHHGVLEFGPTPERPSWLYVTSGYSNPWELEPKEYLASVESGSGTEFTLQTTEQGDWAIVTLQNMLAFDMLLGIGAFEGRERLSLHDRIPLRAPINGNEQCLVRNLVLNEPPAVAGSFTLPSGEVLLPNFVGATDAELAFAKAEGSAELIDRLMAAGYGVVTDPHRKSIL